MARIRTIKPEFWGDEKLAPCDPVTRLTFLGLIGMADDLGRLLDNLKIIDAWVFPETSDTCRDALANLARMGRIRRGMTASGQRVIQIVNWEHHQKVDKPNLAAALPEIVGTEGDTDVRDGFATSSPTPRESVAPLPTTNDQRPTTNERWTRDRDDFLAAVPDGYRPDVAAAFRAAKSPDALLRSLIAITEGTHPPAYDHATIGQAVQEMAAAGVKLTPNTVRGFCRNIGGARATKHSPDANDMKRWAEEVEEAA